MRPRLLLVILACLLSRPGLANVIYDVTVAYSGDNRDATYSFTMEFPAAPPPVHTEADLVHPAGDFSGEKLVFDGVDLPVTLDSITRLHFTLSPFLLSFETGDHFGGDVGGSLFSCAGPSSESVSCLDEGSRDAFALFEVSTRVVESASVPTGHMLALLVIGLAGLRLAAR